MLRLWHLGAKHEVVAHWLGKNLYQDGFAQSPALTNSGTRIQYSLGYTTDNKPVVVIQDNILDGVPSDQWIDKVKETISQNFSNGIPVDGRLVCVNKMTRDEYTHSKNTQYYQAKDGTIYDSWDSSLEIPQYYWTMEE